MYPLHSFKLFPVFDHFDRNKFVVLSILDKDDSSAHNDKYIIIINTRG